MHEIIEITPLTAFLYAILFIFGVCAMLSGLFMAVFGADKSRSLGFLQMAFGWIGLFILYMFLWNKEFLVTMIVVIIGGILGILAALALMLLLVMKS
jgi:hypothetical protein